jgi:hypothetical protein
MPRLTRTEFVDLCVLIQGLQTKDLLSIQERVRIEAEKRFAKDIEQIQKESMFIEKAKEEAA